MIVGLLLAAGGARRFGSQKLIAPLGGIPLVRHAANALGKVVDEVIVVVGSEVEAVTRALDGVDARIVENPDWARGLSTSLRLGLAFVPTRADAVLVALGDEPSVEPSVSRAVIAAWRETRRPIAVARYEGATGHPALFDRSVFAELETLEGDVGAKRVINQSVERVAYVDVAAEAPLDVDEPEDLQRLNGARAADV